MSPRSLTSPAASLLVCLVPKYGLVYAGSPGYGDRVFPIVCIMIGGVQRTAIVSTFHRRCWFSLQDGQLAGFVPPNLGRELPRLQGSFEKEIKFDIVGIGEVQTLAVMSNLLPEGCCPILGEKVREAMSFSVVEKLSDYPALPGMPPKKRIFFGGSLLSRTGDCPHLR